MLDNLFNSILIISFLALVSYGAMSKPEVIVEADAHALVHLERVTVVGTSLKLAGKA